MDEIVRVRSKTLTGRGERVLRFTADRRQGRSEQVTLGQRPEGVRREQIDTGSGFRQREGPGPRLEEEQALGSWSRKDGGAGSREEWEGDGPGWGEMQGPGHPQRGLCLHESGALCVEQSRGSPSLSLTGSCGESDGSRYRAEAGTSRSLLPRSR